MAAERGQLVRTGSQVGPGGEADATGGHAHAALPRGEQRGQHQAAAGRVATDKHRTRLAGLNRSIGPDVLESGDRIVNGRREDVLRRQAIVEVERHAARRPTDVGDQAAVRADRSEHVAATMHVEQAAIGIGAGQNSPLAEYPVGVSRCERDVVLQWEAETLFHRRSLLRDAQFRSNHAVGLRLHRFDDLAVFLGWHGLLLLPAAACGEVRRAA
ncbi:MAG: hypothetical protein OXG42_07155 [Chloroflexi bacterium]|nr:hypothetical protein [Chloroflexota bacterium]